MNGASWWVSQVSAKVRQSHASAGGQPGSLPSCWTSKWRRRRIASPLPLRRSGMIDPCRFWNRRFRLNASCYHQSASWGLSDYDRWALWALSDYDWSGSSGLSDYDQLGLSGLSDCDQLGLSGLLDCDQLGLSGLSDCDQLGSSGLSDCDHLGSSGLSDYDQSAAGPADCD